MKLAFPAVRAALALGLLSVLQGPAAQEPAPAGAPADALALPEPLRASLAAAAAPGADVEPLARRLGAFGAPVLPYLIALLAGTTEAGELAAPERALVLRTSELVGHDALIAFLRPAAGSAGLRRPAAERGAALALLERNARPQDLALALDLAGGTPDAPAEALLGDELFRVAAAVLRRDAAALGVLTRQAVTARPPAAVSLVRAIGACAEELGPDRDPLGVLSTVLGYDPGLDRAVLGEIGRVSLALPGTAPADLAARIGGYLDDPDAELVREAVQALGRLDAHDALPTLVGMLGDERAAVGEATLWALRSMTGLKLGANAARWRTWLEDESAWWEAEAPAHLAALRSRDDARVRHALSELCKHRLHRDRIAPAIGALLASGSPRLCADAARALAELGAPAGVPFLRELLASHADERLRASALEALLALGVRIPPTGDAGTDGEPLSSSEAAGSSRLELADRGPAAR